MDIRLTDKFFYDSPDPGSPACLCSRCMKPIPRNNIPILRAWPNQPGEYGFDKIASTEFRYCWDCSKEMGVDFGEPDPDFDGW